MNRLRIVPLVAILAASVNGQSSITINDVQGLRDTLNSYVLRSPTYYPGRAAVIDYWGLAPVTGNLEDCVHVDGTSGPCSGPGGPGYRDAEVPSGVLDGINRVFTVSASPMPPESLQVYRNGMLLKSGADYVLDNTSITFSQTAGATPQPSDLLQCYYRVSGGTSYSDAEVPNGPLDGLNRVFTVSASPSPPESLQVYRNGLLLKHGADYVLDNTSITFSPTAGATPQPGDLLQCYYRVSSSPMTPRSALKAPRPAASSQDAETIETFIKLLLKDRATTDPQELRRALRRDSAPSSPVHSPVPRGTDVLTRIAERLNDTGHSQDPRRLATAGAATTTTPTDVPISIGPATAHPAPNSEALSRLVQRVNSSVKTSSRHNTETLGSPLRGETHGRPPMQDAQEDSPQNDAELLQRIRTLLKQH